MNVPDDREYTTSHEWIQLDGESALVGLTAGNPSLAEILQVRLPVVGRAVKAGDEAAAVISRGTEQSVRAPLSGSIIETNSALEADPTLLARHPYGTGWLFVSMSRRGKRSSICLTPLRIGTSFKRLNRSRFPRGLLRNPRMPRCRQFWEDRKEPSAGLMGLRGPHLPQAVALRRSLATPRGPKIGAARRARICVGFST